MPDPAEPRARWPRLLARGVPGGLFAALLYILSYGPVLWYCTNQNQVPRWANHYHDGLRWFYRKSPKNPLVRYYLGWWMARPAPRSWQRQKARDYLESLHAQLLEYQTFLQGIRVDCDHDQLQVTQAQTQGADTFNAALARLNKDTAILDFTEKHLHDLHRYIDDTEKELREIDTR